MLAQLKIEPEGATPQAEIEPLVAMGEQVLADGDAARAVSIFRQILDMAPDNAEVLGGMARALIAAREMDEARALLDGLADEQKNKPEMARAIAALEVASAPKVDTGPLEARLAANADDHEARFELAAAKMAAGDRDGAADALLEIVGRDREWNEGAARKRFLQLLEAQGLEDPWSSAGSGDGCRPSCSREPDAPRSIVPARRGVAVSPLPTAAPHFREPLSRDGQGRDRGRRADRDDPAAAR